MAIQPDTLIVTEPLFRKRQFKTTSRSLIGTGAREISPEPEGEPEGESSTGMEIGKVNVQGLGQTAVAPGILASILGNDPLKIAMGTVMAGGSVLLIIKAVTGKDIISGVVGGILGLLSFPLFLTETLTAKEAEERLKRLTEDASRIV